MPRFSPPMVQRALDTIALYPQTRSALIPLCHLAQEQDGWLTPEAIEHIAELLELEPADVKGTASFYEMFKFEPVGRYLVNVCTNISCMLVGGYELLRSVESHLGVQAGGTTPDGMFSVEEVECIAACTQAPSLLVNYRTFGPVEADKAGTLLDDLRAGRLADTVPPHGVTNRVRRSVAVGPAGAATQPGGRSAPDAPSGEPEASAPGPGAVGPASKNETAPTRDAEDPS